MKSEVLTAVLLNCSLLGIVPYRKDKHCRRVMSSHCLLKRWSDSQGRGNTFLWNVLIFTVSTRRYNHQTTVKTFYFLHCSTRLYFLESIIRLFNDAVSPAEFYIAKATCYFIYGLFNNAVSRSDCMASNGTMVNEQWIWKDMERSGRGLNYPCICLAGLRKTTNNLIEDSVEFEPGTFRMRSRSTNYSTGRSVGFLVF
jgi:hypothetical protein